MAVWVGRPLAVGGDGSRLGSSEGLGVDSNFDGINVLLGAVDGIFVGLSLSVEGLEEGGNKLIGANNCANASSIISSSKPSRSVSSHAPKPI